MVGALLALVSACAAPRQDRRLRAGRDDAGAGFGEGLASFYGPGLYGRKMANGEVLRRGMRIAAHRTLRFGTCLDVRNLRNGRATRVHVTDRGPFVGGRVLDVSEVAADELGMRSEGVTRVRFQRCD